MIHAHLERAIGFRLCLPCEVSVTACMKYDGCLRHWIAGVVQQRPFHQTHRLDQNISDVEFFGIRWNIDRLKRRVLIGRSDA